jgi:hypothetical protein
MSRFIDSWLHAHRLSRAVAAVIVGAGILIWLAWFGPPEMISRDAASGMVISVADGGLVVIELDGGKQVRLRPRVLLKAGDRVPMRVETYEDGSIAAWVNEEAWRMR